ncbi:MULTISPECIES: hypothetical protein [Bacillales]|jgi:hypothetical protein|uniref:Competence protein n=3 Tax=Peribacillus TaxID=2675229 RepID=A0A9W4L7S8_9BACI|nr:MULTISPECIES: hypothetical protein [Bacillales]MBD8135473.1 hypothetical protein [Bacillus sp. CFBP 13597]MBT2603875.1 hypothetical protein [Bacillus sp. ISL-53]MBT2669509.1 hypothetical protein [Streptomyces sp. ISL-14]MCD1159841.1 hypothetical protein [Peribacillus castrilensis]MCP1093720.1 hypothetical protein [Bacillaceae bacterium OS4b]MDP9742381.1 hypothetical protein [Bacillus sp. B2I3]QNK50714.1 hypothetical protein H7F28_11290 [Brevibacterium sp. PAMC23299]QYF81875.1 hypothetica
MGKSSKSKRFVQQGKESVARHAEKIPYHTTFEEAEKDRLRIMSEQSYGGF